MAYINFASNDTLAQRADKLSHNQIELRNKVKALEGTVYYISFDDDYQLPNNCIIKTGKILVTSNSVIIDFVGYFEAEYDPGYSGRLCAYIPRELALLLAESRGQANGNKFIVASAPQFSFLGRPYGVASLYKSDISVKISNDSLNELTITFDPEYSPSGTDVYIQISTTILL